MTATLLVEIGVEELPPAAMRPLATTLAAELTKALTEIGLAHGAVTSYATPRRLAVAIADTAAHTESRTVEKTGPAVAAAFDSEGNPTKAGYGFARSLGVEISALERKDSGKGERLVYRTRQPGQPLTGLIQNVVDTALRQLPIPKRMRWSDSEYSFVRPVHWVVALYGTRVLPLRLFGITAGRKTQGHRFHHPDPIELADAEDYADALFQLGYVIADPDTRAQRILKLVKSEAQRIDGHALIDPALLKEVDALVEWPVAIAGCFEPHFLTLPREVLIATLEGHQRYFPIENKDGALAAGFVTVANIESRDVSQVVAGNERVIRARLADALFFWDQDRELGLENRLPDLARVSFQRALGSLADKTERVRILGGWLANLIGVDTVSVDRAATLAKADLLTEMVNEFPELQGIMGGYYARENGEPRAVYEAISEQYAPVGARAPIPTSSVGRILALAERIDTLAGIFAVGKRPSGDKDPFALRRAALAVIRLLIEAGIDIDLVDSLEQAVALQPVEAKIDLVDTLWTFHVERLRGYYSEQDISTGLFDAVAALNITNICDFDRRLQAVFMFSKNPTATTVVDALKRIRNIIRRNANEPAEHFSEKRLVEPAEQRLNTTFRQKQQTINAYITSADYTQALVEMAELAKPLDEFFNEVMVMTEEPSLRRNRLALLHNLDRLSRKVADLSYLSF